MPREIVISFNPDGSVEIAPKGFTGTACQAATKPYETALTEPGSTVRQDIPERYATVTPKQAQR